LIRWADHVHGVNKTLLGHAIAHGDKKECRCGRLEGVRCVSQTVAADDRVVFLDALEKFRACRT